MAAGFGWGAFARTGNAPLTIILGSAAPTMQPLLFWESPRKAVTVRVPAGARGYGTVPVSMSGANRTLNWANGFRGGGYSGPETVVDKWWEIEVNANVTLNIMYP